MCVFVCVWACARVHNYVYVCVCVTGEKEGREQSLKQCQQLLQDVREEQSKTAGQLHNSELQLKAVTDSKEEVCAEGLKPSQTLTGSLSLWLLHQTI